LLHPLMPFITEELWQRLPHTGETVCLADFPQADGAQIDAAAEREMELLIAIVTKLRNIRSTFNIAPSVPLRAEVAAPDEASRGVVAAMADQIKRLARLESLDSVEAITLTSGAARDVVGGVELAVPLAGLVDFDKERGRLESTVAKLTKELEGVEKRLSNQDFIARAAAEVVAETRARAGELHDQIAKLKAAAQAL
jgi:valyl-tRNA synthetase